MAKVAKNDGIAFREFHMTLIDGAGADPSAEHLWLHYSRLADEAGDDLVVIERGEGAYVWDTQRPPLPRRARRAVRGAGRSRPQGARPGRRRAGREARLLPAVDLRPPDRDRAGGPPGRAGTRRPQPGVPDHRRRRGGRDGVEAGRAVLRRDRTARAHQGRGAAHRVPRLQHRCAEHHRSRGDQGAVPAAAQRPRQPRRHDQQAALRAVLRLGHVHARLCERHRAGDPRGRTGDGRRGLPGAGAERRRLLHARPRATSSGSARSATATGSCSSPTRSSARSAASATGSAPAASGTSPT